MPVYARHVQVPEKARADCLEVRIIGSCEPAYVGIWE